MDAEEEANNRMPVVVWIDMGREMRGEARSEMGMQREVCQVDGGGCIEVEEGKKA